MRLASCPLLAALALTLALVGCSGAPASAPEPVALSADAPPTLPTAPLDAPTTREQKPTDVDREASGSVTGVVTVNGLLNQPPDGVASPGKVKLTAKAGMVGFITLSAQALPEAAHVYLIEVAGDVDYGAFIVASDGLPAQVPIFFESTGPVTFTLHNSLFGPTYDEAVAFTYDISTGWLDRTGEPDDDEAPLTIDDRTLGRRLEVVDEVADNLYVHIPDLDQDREEWWVYTPGWSSGFTITIAPDDAWGAWAFDLRVFDEDGALEYEALDQRGDSIVYPHIARTSGTRYIQLVGHPLSDPYLNLQYLPYTIRAEQHFDPQPASWTPLETLPFSSSSAALASHGSGLVIAYEWIGDLHLAQTTAELPLASDWTLSEVGSVGFPQQLLSLHGRLYIVSRSSGDFRFNASLTDTPAGPDDWARLNFYPGLSMTEHQGRLALAGRNVNSTIVGVATVDQPSELLDFSWHTAHPQPSAHNLNGVVYLASLEDRLALYFSASASLGDGNSVHELLFQRALMTSPDGPEDWNLHQVATSTGWFIGDAATGLAVTDGRFLARRTFDSEGSGQGHTRWSMLRSASANPAGASEWSETIISESHSALQDPRAVYGPFSGPGVVVLGAWALASSDRLLYLVAGGGLLEEPITLDGSFEPFAWAWAHGREYLLWSDVLSYDASGD